MEKGHGSNNDNDSSPGLSIDEAESEEETLAEASVQSTSKENQSSAVTNQAVPKNASTSSTDSDKSPAESEQRAALYSLMQYLLADRHRTSPLQNKRTNENSENVSVSKRSKVNDDSSDKYLRGRILSLQEENKKLKEKIEDMESNWMRNYLLRYVR